MAKRSGWRGRIEPVDELGELFEHGSIVIVWEVDDLAMAVGRLSAVAARLMDHPEAVPAIVHVGEANQQVACSRLGLVEFGRTDEVHHGVGGGIELVLMVVFLRGPGEARGDLCPQLTKAQTRGNGVSIVLRLVAPSPLTPRLGLDKAVARGRLVLGETALLVFVAAAAVARSLRPGFGLGLAMLFGTVEAAARPHVTTMAMAHACPTCAGN